MKLVAAKHASIEKVEQFLQENQELTQDSLLHDGYLVEIEDKIEGCFALQPLEPGVYWLKQLHVTKKAAPSLPVLLESVLTLAKEKNAKSVYVYSHQPVVDLLLDALQFRPQTEKEIVDIHTQKKGNWWLYNVS